ncbi:hypothetical protein ACFP1I_02300 [Dyadobacter subterraneus]|uniref:Uncharacterized protein n=1 Tax=Dyadobacter subterraneus TaxID=2773304 RepID=A0ABR9WBJ5_9BACT|nr:hypothetical protein [Dyadobacter subterraneus]MBE9461584.1 hypothetical protein [Dyadobacter subterraneus]
MKNNFRFIFPRLVGATLVVGLAAFVITTLFKLMLGLVLIGGIVTLIRRAAGRNQMMAAHIRNGQFGNNEVINIDGGNPWAASTNPVHATSTIVPIN